MKGPRAGSLSPTATRSRKFRRPDGWMISPKWSRITSAARNNEAALLAVLKPNAGQKEKADACRELARKAGKEVVPVLAALLADEQLSHMARYALETIPDPSVNQALRAALTTLSGRQLVGVIGSLGVRRDANAVQPLSNLLTAPDPEVAQAAARALGFIGTPEAARALQITLATA